MYNVKLKPPVISGRLHTLARLVSLSAHTLSPAKIAGETVHALNAEVCVLTRIVDSGELETIAQASRAGGNVTKFDAYAMTKAMQIAATSQFVIENAPETRLQSTVESAMAPAGC